MSEGDELNRALALLGELLEARKLPPVDLVVCGGAALREAGIVSRVTKDVDVMARRGDVDRELMSAWPLPEELKEAVADVAAELHLPQDWLNASTSMLMVPLDDLPGNLWTEVIEKEFGSCLRIGFVGRVGQLYLKTYAVIGREKLRDLEDLKALAPTSGEWRAVVAWLEKCGLLDEAKRARLLQVKGEVSDG